MKYNPFNLQHESCDLGFGDGSESDTYQIDRKEGVIKAKGRICENIIWDLFTKSFCIEGVDR